MEQHFCRHRVERLLDTVDAVVYILDYTKLKTSEEANLLAALKEANPQLVQRLAQRLFFVVNKIDCMHSNIGLQEEELREYVADLITKQMNSPAFQLHPEQVESQPPQKHGACSGRPINPQTKSFGSPNIDAIVELSRQSQADGSGMASQ